MNQKKQERVELVDKRFNVLLITLFLNGIAALSKIIVGVETGLLMVTADGLHSLGDMVSNIICMVSLSYARRSPDEKYPYGYAKFETIAAFGVGFLLLLGVREILERLYHRFMHPNTISFGWWVFGVMVVTMIINIWVVWYETKRGKELLGDSLIIDAAETRNDIFVTIGVLGGLVAMKSGFWFADPLLATIIIIVILKSFWRNLKWTFGVLADSAIVSSKEIERVVMDVPGVQFCHAIRSRGRPDAFLIDLHIGVLPSISVEEAHDDISHRVKTVLRKHFKNLQCANIQIEPDNEPTRLRTRSVFKEGDY